MKRVRRSVKALTRKRERRKPLWDLVRKPVPRPSRPHKDDSIYDRKRKVEEEE